MAKEQGKKTRLRLKKDQGKKKRQKKTKKTTKGQRTRPRKDPRRGFSPETRLRRSLLDTCREPPAGKERDDQSEGQRKKKESADFVTFDQHQRSDARRHHSRPEPDSKGHFHVDCSPNTWRAFKRLRGRGAPRPPAKRGKGGKNKERGTRGEKEGRKRRGREKSKEKGEKKRGGEKRKEEKKRGRKNQGKEAEGRGDRKDKRNWSRVHAGKGRHRSKEKRRNIREQARRARSKRKINHSYRCNAMRARHPRANNQVEDSPVVFA